LPHGTHATLAALAPRTPSLHGHRRPAWRGGQPSDSSGGSGSTVGGSRHDQSARAVGFGASTAQSGGGGPDSLSLLQSSSSNHDTNVVKQWRGSGGESMLVMLCAFDIWLSVLWLYVVVLAIVCTPGIQLIWTSEAHSTPYQNGSSTDAAYEPFIALFGLLFCGASVLVTIALLALFFMREWALVLFLWKLFELLGLLLLLLSYTLTSLAGLRPSDETIAISLLTTVGFYVLYTLVLLRQLWQIPRVREHYRRLPTRREIATLDSGMLQYGSFFFRRQDLLGAGGTARVYKGMYAGKLVAVKEIASTAMIPYGRAEAALLSRLRHPYVLHFYGCCAHDHHLYLVTELCDTTLKELIARREQRQRLALEPALSLAMQIAEGLSYVHEAGVVHRDLSSSNIFLSVNEAAGGAISAKIGDFGLSRRTAEETSMTALIGTIQYMAPEMLTSAASGGRVEYSAAIDIFSFGIILWQLITCSQPYANLLGVTINRWQLLQRIARDGLRPEVPAYAPRALVALMTECWAAEEQLRPASNELVRRLRLFYLEAFGAEFGERLGVTLPDPDESAAAEAAVETAEAEALSGRRSRS